MVRNGHLWERISGIGTPCSIVALNFILMFFIILTFFFKSSAILDPPDKVSEVLNYRFYAVRLADSMAFRPYLLHMYVI